MSLQAILDAIREAGDKQVCEIETGARDRVQDMLCKAQAESDRLREEARLAAAAPATEQCLRLMQQAQAEARRAVSGEHEALIDTVLERSREALASIRADPVYPSVLRHLTVEALTDLRQPLGPGEEISLEADPLDRSVLESLLPEIAPNLEVSYTLSCCGGVVASSGDGHILAINTLEARLERSTPYLRRYLFRLLVDEPAEPDLVPLADPGT